MDTVLRHCVDGSLRLTPECFPAKLISEKRWGEGIDLSVPEFAFGKMDLSVFLTWTLDCAIETWTEWRDWPRMIRLARRPRFWHIGVDLEFICIEGERLYDAAGVFKDRFDLRDRQHVFPGP